MTCSRLSLFFALAILLGPGWAAAQSPYSVRLAQPAEIGRVAHHENLPPVTPPVEWQFDAASAPNSLPQAEKTLADLEQIALENNPALAAAQARIEAAEGHWTQVGLHPNPTIGYSGQDIGDEGTSGKQGAFIGQRVITADKRGLNRAVAEQQIALAEQQWSEWRQRVLTDVRIGFYDVLISQRRLAITTDLLAASESGVKVARQLVEVQETSRVDVLQARVEHESVKIRMQKARNDEAAAWRRLAAVLGVPNMQPQRLHGDIDAVRRDIHWQDALTRLVSESPEMGAAHAEHQRAEWALDRAYAEKVPNIDVTASVHHDNASGDTVTGIELGIPLPLFNRNQGGIAKAEAEVRYAEVQIERLELNLQQRLAVVFQRYADSRFEVDKYARDILPIAQESQELMARSYRAGESGYLTLLTAQRTYFQTNLAYIGALRELWAASLEIDGLLLTGGLQRP